MAEDKCKHEGQEAAFCAHCGKQLDPEPEVTVIIERAVRKALKEFGIKPTEKEKETEHETLADRMLGKKGAKK